MQPVSVRNRSGGRHLVLTCEHASCAVPVEYDDLGLSRDDLQEHIGWDIGAGDLTHALAERCDALAVLAGVSRLVIDCNRDLADHDLIVTSSHGVHVPGNQQLDADERRNRIRDFYEPYHETVGAMLAGRSNAVLLSVHSFTPVLNGSSRRFDVGVLFDEFPGDANRLGADLARQGLSVRYNQPYSGLDGLIYSARAHGTTHRRRYLELEVNNRLLRDPQAVAQLADVIAPVLRRWWEEPCD
jgi:predicted N-formylglutamate amidohydrolase